MAALESDTNTPSTTDFIPNIIPCCYGTEVGVEPKIISTGLSAISIKRSPQKRNSKDNDPSGKSTTVENRNSFFNLHRPELTKINWLSTSPRKIEQFFHNHATKHGPFCAYLHGEMSPPEEDFKCILPPSEFNYHEEEFLGLSGSMGNSVLLKTCSMRISDEDLDPNNVCHRSRAEFCVTIGKDMPKIAENSMLVPEDEPRELLVTENRDLLTPLGTRHRDRGKHHGSSLALQQLSTLGESAEMATFSPTYSSDTSTDVDEEISTREENDAEDIPFRTILEHREDTHRGSYPNEVTPDDELIINNLKNYTTKMGGTAGPPGRNIYQKAKPPPKKSKPV